MSDSTPAPKAKPDTQRIILQLASVALFAEHPDSNPAKPLTTVRLLDGTEHLLVIAFDVLITILKTSDPAIRVLEVTLQLPEEPEPIAKPA